MIAQTSNQPLKQSLKATALITGGSNGIGLELAKQFAENGYDLIIASSNSKRLERAAEILTALPQKPQVATVLIDLSTDTGAAQLYDQTQKLGWNIDVLCNNAGQGVYGDFARETDLKKELATIHLNIISLTHLTKLYVKDMLKRGRGKILFTASLVSVSPSPNLAVYAATKAYVYSFAEAIRDELKGTNITITALMPNATDTDFFQRAGAQNTRTANGNLDDPQDVAKAGYDALMRGDDHVVYGLSGKLTATMAKLMPPTMAAANARVE